MDTPFTSVRGNRSRCACPVIVRVAVPWVKSVHGGTREKKFCPTDGLTIRDPSDAVKNPSITYQCAANRHHNPTGDTFSKLRTGKG